MHPLKSANYVLLLCLSGSVVFAQDKPNIVFIPVDNSAQGDISLQSDSVLTVQAQEPGPISTERPSFSSSPIALASGRWQFEFGYQYSKDDEGASVQNHILPLLLIRTGVTDRLELQINWPGYSWTDVNGSSGHGANDVGIGVKWQVSDSSAATPIGIFAGLTLAVGSSDIGADEAEPVLGLFWSHSGRISLFGTVLISEASNDSVINNAIGLDLHLPGRKGAYVEYLITAQEGTGPEHSLGAGISFHRSSDLQFDVNASIGLNDRATDFYIGVGAARRF